MEGVFGMQAEGIDLPEEPNELWQSLQEEATDNAYRACIQCKVTPHY